MTTEPATLDQIRTELSSSASRLAAVVEPLGPDAIRQQSYCDDWTVADVLSHLGSGAVIFRERIDGEVEAQAIWDEWNAKDPDDQAADALAADSALMARVAAFDAAEEAATDRRFAMGPMQLDLATFLGLRLNEHVVHTWDIEVTQDSSATLPESAVALLFDPLEIMAGFVGKPTGAEKTYTVRTGEPSRLVTISVSPERVSLSLNAGSGSESTGAGSEAGAVDLELPAEAFIRLVYGRLDQAHTPTVSGTASASVAAETLDELRQLFPGF
jgi:uncharacterized protein (TIGR03083 family)